MRNRYLLGAGVALAMALSWGNAQAQVPGAWYFGGEGGWTALDNEGGKFTSGPLAGLKHSQSFNDGFNIGARAGYEWGPWRLEEEFRYQTNGQHRFRIDGVNFKSTGNRDAYAVMSHLIYDANMGWTMTPHTGGGIGVVGLHDAVGIKGSGTNARSTDWKS